jgi:hypothetical protein
MAGVAQYQLNPFPYPRDAGRILDLIPQERTNAPAVHYFAETTAATAAAAVAEGAAKPESTPVWTEVTATVRKLAHHTRVNDEVVADFDAFRQVIGNSMLAGLIATENAQLITGTGVAPNLLGLATNPSVLTVGSARTDLDGVAAGFAAVRVGAAHCDPDVVVMHPNDWYSAGFLLAKETTGGSLVRSLVTAVKPMLWGVPVILSEYMTENTALVANLKIAATASIRHPPVVEVAPYSGGTTEFIANQTLVRAEGRLALAIHHPGRDLPRHRGGVDPAWASSPPGSGPSRVPLPGRKASEGPFARRRRLRPTPAPHACAPRLRPTPAPHACGSMVPSGRPPERHSQDEQSHQPQRGRCRTAVGRLAPRQGRQLRGRRVRIRRELCGR